MWQFHCQRQKTGQIWELAALGSVTVHKSKNEPSSLTATILRDKMTVEIDDVVAVQLNELGKDDVNLFYGYVENTSKFMDEVKITAYDQLYLLKQSKEFKVYGSKRADEIYRQIIKEHELFSVEPAFIANTEYVIPDVIADGTDPLSLMTEALNVTFRSTGKRYFMYDFFRNLCLGETDSEDYKIPITDYELDEWNVESYSYDQDGTKRANEIIVKSENEAEKDKLLAVRRDDEEIKRIGSITYHQKIKDGENADIVADTLFTEKREIPQDLTVTAYGVNPQAYPGRLIHVDFFSARKEYIKGWFVIEEADYTLDGGRGMTNFKLSLDTMEVEDFGI